MCFYERDVIGIEEPSREQDAQTMQTTSDTSKVVETTFCDGSKEVEPMFRNGSQKSKIQNVAENTISDGSNTGTIQNDAGTTSAGNAPKKRAASETQRRKEADGADFLLQQLFGDSAEPSDQEDTEEEDEPTARDTPDDVCISSDDDAEKSDDEDIFRLRCAPLPELPTEYKKSPLNAWRMATEELQTKLRNDVTLPAWSMPGAAIAAAGARLPLWHCPFVGCERCESQSKAKTKSKRTEGTKQSRSTVVGAHMA